MATRDDVIKVLQALEYIHFLPYEESFVVTEKGAAFLEQSFKTSNIGYELFVKGHKFEALVTIYSALITFVPPSFLVGTIDPVEWEKVLSAYQNHRPVQTDNRPGVVVFDNVRFVPLDGITNEPNAHLNLDGHMIPVKYAPHDSDGKPTPNAPLDFERDLQQLMNNSSNITPAKHGESEPFGTVGIYHKYIVLKKDGTPVESCFVLRPDKDEAAREAILAYADACQRDNPKLSHDLLNWIQEIQAGLE